MTLVDEIDDLGEVFSWFKENIDILMPSELIKMSESSFSIQILPTHKQNNQGTTVLNRLSRSCDRS